MEQFEHDPCGETGLIQSQTEIVLPSGWRKPTAALQIADNQGEAGERKEIEKGRAIIAVKRVAAHIGLKAADILLLDTLFAFSKPQDWAAGQRPIVWPSNAFLMEQTGFSRSTLKRHARRLVECGLLTFQDSPNGKRWGRRNDEGLITEAYGFDLSPVAAQTEQLEALAKKLASERALCLRHKREITILRRNIRAQLETAQEGALPPNASRPLQNAFESLLGRLKQRITGSEPLRAILDQFKDLFERLKTVLKPEHEIVDPTEAINEPHIQTTQRNSQISCTKNTEEPSQKKEAQTSHVGIPAIISACPQFSTWVLDLGESLRTWQDLLRISCTLRPMIGISDRTWTQALEQLGPKVAPNALALVFEKHCTGEITSPSGYLRGIIRKARAGELHLDRSFYGRLSNQPTAKPQMI